jgi:hypothetical protein
MRELGVAVWDMAAIMSVRVKGAIRTAYLFLSVSLLMTVLRASRLIVSLAIVEKTSSVPSVDVLSFSSSLEIRDRLLGTSQILVISSAPSK